MKVLGIETSCDETAVAIYCETAGLLTHQIYSQVEIHAAFGGVVPELASRDHIRKCLPLVEAALANAGLAGEQLAGVAYTRGPGLIGALLVGASIGRSLGWAWNIPTIGVHHLEAHLLAVMLEPNPPSCPFLALLVSGGHTLLIHVAAIGQYQILGETLDDAVGEAFDKTANLLGLGYPGGAALAQLAAQGDPQRFYFPRPMLHHAGFDFSFSGLKTHAANCVKQHDDSLQTRADIACAFQQAVIDILWIKSQQAMKMTGLDRLVVAGGVSANQGLRQRFYQEIQQRGQVFFPRPEFSTDNAAMVAYTGYTRLKAGQHDDLRISVDPRWDLQHIV